jgi:hypothetical protein
MALTTTTLSSAVATGDTQIVVASATGFAVGYDILIDQEVMRVTKNYNGTSTTVPVSRGRGGTATSAHPASANVTVGDPGADFASNLPQFATLYPLGNGRTLASYSAAGAISLPNAGADAVAILNGTTALAMTLANPTKDMDGCILYIVGNGKAAHTVTYTAGLGNGGSNLDVLTCATGAQQCLAVIAANAIWVPMPSVLAGTLTNITITAA